MSIDAKGMRKLKKDALPIDKATLTDSDGLHNVDEQIDNFEIDLPSLNNTLDDDNIVNNYDMIDNIEAPELIKHAKPVIINVENASSSLANHVNTNNIINTNPPNKVDVDPKIIKYQNTIKELQDQLASLQKENKVKDVIIENIQCRAHNAVVKIKRKYKSRDKMRYKQIKSKKKKKLKI